MTSSAALVCDGCGQLASPEHIARRLQRLEWTTRFRPVHIQTLLLGAFSPREDSHFLYSPGGEFAGEAGILLEAAGISAREKTAEAVRMEFQRAGLFLTHVLECPPESVDISENEVKTLLKKRLPVVATRIRRSLKPKRVTAITANLLPVVKDVLALDLGGCPVLLDGDKPFRLDLDREGNAIQRLREALTSIIVA